MISRLPGSILHRRAIFIFSSASSHKKSWFQQIRDLCLQYRLPHPLQLLSKPLSKLKFKKLVKSHIIDYWEIKLRTEALPLTSLEFFNPSFMSLKTPHPIWRTAGSSPAKVTMATVQAKMLSGRYRTQLLCSHFTPQGSKICQLSQCCKESGAVEDLRHILTQCKALDDTRETLINFAFDYSRNCEPIKLIVSQYCNASHPQFCQFLVDCSILPEIIAATQINGSSILDELFHITRTICYSLHKARLKILGRWNYI